MKSKKQVLKLGNVSTLTLGYFGDGIELSKKYKWPHQPPNPKLIKK